MMTGCSGASDDNASSSKSTPTPSATPTRDTTLELGQATKRTTAKWQALEYRRDALPGDTSARGRWDAVRWRNCNVSEKRKNLQQRGFLAANFILRDTDGGQYEPSYYSGGVQPIYPEDRRVSVGDCVTGWIMYDVPEGTKTADVALIDDGTVFFTWSLR